MQVDRLVKTNLQEKKVGHLGTLDPFATGLLIIGVGDATKLFTLIEEDKKTYVATLYLGKSTDTFDYLGKTLEEKEIVSFTKDDILKVFSSFLGKQKQMPPKYSAKHVNGIRAYTLAANNKEVNLEPQEIEIYSLDLISYDSKSITFKACVSKGTYIRTLGVDIASKLNNLGYLSKLRRESIGNYNASDAIQIDDINDSNLIPIENFFNFKNIEITDEKEKKWFLNGTQHTFKNENDEYLFIKIDNRIIALYKKEKDHHYICYKSFYHGNK